MHPSHIAAQYPNRPAIVMAGTEASLSYDRLERESNRLAHLFRLRGIRPGEVIALLMENRIEIFTLAWAAQRSGLYWTCLPTKLLAGEVEYILRDSSAKLFVVSATTESTAQTVRDTLVDLPTLTVDGSSTEFESLYSACSTMLATPIPDQSQGSDMLYSSGTTGRPKGIKPPLPGGPIDAPSKLARLMTGFFDFAEGCKYLCPAPLYHAGPLRWSMNIHRIGGTVVVLDRFDAESALRLIEQERIDCGQFVPTHFVRMLKLPEAVRRQFDVSSLKSVVHAAAPCPVPIKEQMIEWLGPIVHEYYAGTEGNGLTAIKAEDWLTHKGSVGRAVTGTLRICNEQGEPVPPRTEGTIYFEGGPPLSYHNDPQKTAESHNRHGWSTLGDVGWVDDDGYLYLTDRKSFMIISGGVNIYPQEIENLLVSHPEVADAAVIGAPDPDFGEKVVAVVQTISRAHATPEFGEELQHFIRAHLSPIKTPKQIDFVAELPRQPTGKINKRSIRQAYWDNT